jgi:1,3-propanediol dehydrogenase
LSNTAINVKLGVFVRSTLAIVDPELTLSVPSAVTAATGLDALSHAVESITAKNWNPRSEVLALAAIQKIATNLLAAFQDGSNIQARTELCLASNWAGIAFADTDVHFGHCMADALSAAFHTPHGINCAWATPALIEMLAPALADKIRLTGEAMGISFSGNETAEKIGAMTAQSVRDLMRSVAIKSPSDMGFERQNVINCTQASLENGLCYNCPIELTEKNVQKAFAQIYDDYA